MLRVIYSIYLIYLPTFFFLAMELTWWHFFIFRTFLATVHEHPLERLTPASFPTPVFALLNIENIAHLTTNMQVCFIYLNFTDRMERSSKFLPPSVSNKCFDRPSISRSLSKLLLGANNPLTLNQRIRFWR